MSTIMTAIQLTDRMTGPLRNITSAMTSTIQGLQEIQSSSGKAFDPSALNSARTQIEIANSQMNQLSNSTRTAETAQSSYNRQVTSGTQSVRGLVSAVTSLVTAYGFKKALDLSDTMSQNTARLNLMNDGLQSTAQLQRMIYQAATDSRGSYLDMTNLVAKLGVNAGSAFRNSKEIVAFAEQVNKQFVISGASATETSNATLQLVQALSSGVLRGDELRSIFEQAPSLIQSVADYMNVPIGKIRDMAADGQVTADIVKNAMFAAADETNKKFNSMPMTWGQVWNSVCNELITIGQPVLTLLSTMARNWEIIRPVIIAAGVALGAYTLTLVAYNVQKGISNVQSYLAAKNLLAEASAHGINVAALSSEALAQAAAAVGMDAHALSMANATVAQHGFNAALFACPLTWIVLAIIAVIGAIYVVCAATNKWKGTHYSATGVIVGSIWVVCNLFKNLGLGIADVALGIWNGMKACGTNIGVAFHNGACNAQNAFYSLQSTAYTCISNIASWLNKLPFVNFDTSGLKASADYYASKAADARGSKNEYTDVGAAFKSGVSTYKVFESGWVKKAYGRGNKIGTDLAEAAKNKLFGKDDSEEKAKTLANSLANTAANTGKTAGNTSKIANSLDVSNENLKYLRDVAERDIINRFTTASIKVEMTNHNSLSSGADVDGMMGQLSAKLRVALEEVREGVPA